MFPGVISTTLVDRPVKTDADAAANQTSEVRTEQAYEACLLDVRAANFSQRGQTSSIKWNLRHQRENLLGPNSPLRDLLFAAARELLPRNCRSVSHGPPVHMSIKLYVDNNVETPNT